MRSVYVGNIGFQISEAALRSEFEAFGRVKKVQMGWGSAIVEMANAAAAYRAISDLSSRTDWALQRLSLPSANKAA